MNMLEVLAHSPAAGFCLKYAEVVRFYWRSSLISSSSAGSIHHNYNFIIEHV